MKKGMVIGFLTAFIITAFYSVSLAAERPRDFRGIAWGTHISKLQGFVLEEEKTPPVINDPLLRKFFDAKEKQKRERNVKIYVRPSDDLKVGRGQVDAIEYVFVRDEFYSVIMSFKDQLQYLLLKSLFSGLYGSPDKEEKRNSSVDKKAEHSWYANTDDEANVTLFWRDWLDGSPGSGSVSIKWKGGIKRDAGL